MHMFYTVLAIINLAFAFCCLLRGEVEKRGNSRSAVSWLTLKMAYGICICECCLALWEVEDLWASHGKLSPEPANPPECVSVGIVCVCVCWVVSGRKYMSNSKCICTNIYIYCVYMCFKKCVSFMLLHRLRPCLLTSPNTSDSSSFLYREERRKGWNLFHI